MQLPLPNKLHNRRANEMRAKQTPPTGASGWGHRRRGACGREADDRRDRLAARVGLVLQSQAKRGHCL